jgi:hypothetical protein
VFMVAQAYLDESYTEGQIYVLAGYLARAQDWAKFSEEWEHLLPLTNRGNSNKRRFKMAEMANAMDRVPPFYDIIRKYAAFGISVAMDARDLERAKSRIWSDNTHIIWSHRDSVEALLFRLFVGTVYNACWDDKRIREWLEPNEKIDLYFDNNSVSDVVMEEWSDAIKIFPDHIKDLVGYEPRFVDDEDFPPVQAADFWAWWVREGHEKGRLAQIAKGDFGSWNSTKVPGIWVLFGEDQLTSTLMELLRKGAVIPGLVNIYDEKAKPRGESALSVHEFPKCLSGDNLVDLNRL